jgi:hypothetical protein
MALETAQGPSIRLSHDFVISFTRVSIAIQFASQDLPPSVENDLSVEALKC